mmetsp:Transcript_1795/g.6590  ORF Transcript_1795/g.6590 Transcript_1795/m.6590 type:complete len:119 (+) Transcript_1795:50-406(+)
MCLVFSAELVLRTGVFVDASPGRSVIERDVHRAHEGVIFSVQSESFILSARERGGPGDGEGDGGGGGVDDDGAGLFTHAEVSARGARARAIDWVDFADLNDACIRGHAPGFWRRAIDG